LPTRYLGLWETMMMDVWTLWTDGLANALAFLSTHAGLSQAWAIAILTIAARLAMMPVSIGAALRAGRNRERIEALKPELTALRNRLKDDPRALTEQTMALYRQNGIRFLDRLTLANLVGQTVFGLGMFRMLRKIKLAARFLWISDIAKPDLILALVTGTLMLLAMALAPGSHQQMSLVMIMIPVAISVISIMTFPSAIGLYWASSNLASLTQTLVVRRIIVRQRR
jgi:YidC/Oxa1 family membrane protein insertase